MPADAKTTRFAYQIKQDFRKSYGAAFDAGAIGPGLVDGLIRGLAFNIISAQDEDTDIKGLMPHFDAAVIIVNNDIHTRAI
jgi:hypothetical protein